MPEHDELPTELLAIVLSLLPSGQAAVAAPTCKRWWSLCCPKERRLLLASVACSSVAMLEWALGKATWRCCSGSLSEAALGAQPLVPWQRQVAIWNCCGGLGSKVALGIVCPLALRQQGVDAWKYCNGNGGHITEWALIAATANRHLEVVQWFYENFPEHRSQMEQKWQLMEM